MPGYDSASTLTDLVAPLLDLVRRDPYVEPKKPEVVYFIERAGLVKISVTTDLMKSLMEIPGSRLLATTPGGRGEEQAIHRRFRDLHMNGEWFMLSPALRQYIQSFDTRMVTPPRAPLRPLPEQDWAKPEVVYFVEREGLVKIGTTRNLKNRIKAISRGSSMIPGMTVGPVQFLGSVPGGRFQEAALHRRFNHLRVDGEWFLLDHEIHDFIGTLDACHLDAAQEAFA